MIGSTAQQFLTYLSHRGEETGNIRGSMKVRVPAERVGTRERLYEWISIDKDETGAAKGKPASVSRASQDYVRSIGRKAAPGESAAPPLAKLFDDPEKLSGHSTSRPPVPLPASAKEDSSLSRSKQDAPADLDGAGLKNSFNNPAYYVLEGVPHQLLATEGQSPLTLSKPAAGKHKVAITVPVQPEKYRQAPPHHPPALGEESSSDDDLGTLNLPPPDFPPPPLPKSAGLEMVDNPFYASARELQPPPLQVPKVGAVREEPDARHRHHRLGVAFSEPLESKASARAPPRAPFSQAVTFLAEPPQPPQGPVDDRSCSVLQMARTLSEVDYSAGGGGLGRGSHLHSGKGKLDLPSRCLHSDYSRPAGFPSRCIQESIKEDLAEEALCQGGRSSSSLSESSVGEWLRAIGLQRYEEGLIHNGWDDLEFLSDITKDDLEEAGVLDPAHKKAILDSLQQTPRK
ncbi:phosphatidylinositol 3,4,5-trisphosphate 5-phosphatase 2-like [Rhinatrema bivittatum]|uniref:phosphatidylinositol 3,4,5-trisphosphate 5-phosphatase 2-like n=1 Tax=Rhinatrema bivittatum TaxID=194408 RepID=UPI00112C3FE5|nr:phosphatidylinositol 3,4,5-trisphosphate 5-phosphatase 2-like [Rhinatrema bivittatum]